MNAHFIDEESDAQKVQMATLYGKINQQRNSFAFFFFFFFFVPKPNMTFASTEFL